MDLIIQRFGLATCVDLLWESPEDEVVRQMNIDTLIYGIFGLYQISGIRNQINTGIRPNPN